MASVSDPTLDSLDDFTPIFRRQTESHSFPWTQQQTEFTEATRKDESKMHGEKKKSQCLLLKQKPLKGEMWGRGDVEMIMLKNFWRPNVGLHRKQHPPQAHLLNTRFPS